MKIFNKILRLDNKLFKRKQKNQLVRCDEKIEDSSKIEEEKNKSILRRLKFETYTKRLVAIVVFISLLDLQLSYALAFLGRDQIAETLSGQICITLLGTILVYIIRAYFDTEAEKRNDMIRSGVIMDDKAPLIIPDEIILNKLQEIIDNSGLSEHINSMDTYNETTEEFDDSNIPG